MCVSVCVRMLDECPCTLRDLLEMGIVSWQDGLGLDSRSIATGEGPIDAFLLIFC